MSGCKGGCGGCCGSCGSCGGNGAMVMAPEEIEMLRLLGQIPFLPVARRADSVDPVYFGEGARAIIFFPTFSRPSSRKFPLGSTHRCAAGI